MAVRASIQETRRLDLEEGNCELLWAELTLAVGKLLIGIYYRPPGSSSDDLQHLRRSLTAIPMTQPYIVCGDFNVPSINWETIFPISSSRTAHELGPMENTETESGNGNGNGKRKRKTETETENGNGKLSRMRKVNYADHACAKF